MFAKGLREDTEFGDAGDRAEGITRYSLLFFRNPHSELGISQFFLHPFFSLLTGKSFG